MITNAQIAELLAAEAEQAKPPIQRALRKAGRSVFLWPVEAAELLEPLSDLFGVGGFRHASKKNVPPPPVSSE